MFGRKRTGEGDPPKERRRPFFGRRAYDAIEAEDAAPYLPTDDDQRCPTPDHSASRAADPYAFEVAYTRVAWVARLLAMGFTGSVALNLVLGGMVGTLVPLQKLELGVIRVEPSTDRTVKVDPASLVRVLPIAKDAEGFDLLMESFVRRYVRLLLEIDPVGHQDRLTEANRLSDTDFWKRFVKEKYPAMKDALKSGLNRSVVIASAERISERGGVYRYLVVFDQVDERDGKVAETKRIHAYLAVTSRPQTVRVSEKFENPLGFRVLDLSLKERGTS